MRSPLYESANNKHLFQVIEEDGTAAVLNVSFTESGNLLAYSISRSGSDWRTLQVLVRICINVLLVFCSVSIFSILFRIRILARTLQIPFNG